MRFRLKAFSILEFGQRVDAEGKPHQEDSLFPVHGQLKESDRLFIVCDGMGGHDAGEVASATVCEAMSKAVMEKTPEPEGTFSDEVFLYALGKAYDALDERDNGAVKKMGTTMTFLKLHKDGCTIAHIGDSRVYHIRPGKDAQSTEILFCTRDHSLVNDLIKIGELTPEEAKNSPQKNVITRAMQPNMERRCKADIYHTLDIRPGDYFYLCTDGMLENSEEENIRFIFSHQTGDDENKKDVLRKVTAENRDNHSAIVVHILRVEGAAPIAEPTSTTTIPAADKPAPLMATVEKETKQLKQFASKFLRFIAIVIVLAIVTCIVLFTRKGNGNQEEEIADTIHPAVEVTPIKVPIPKTTPTPSDTTPANQQQADTSIQ